MATFVNISFLIAVGLLILGILLFDAGSGKRRHSPFFMTGAYAIKNTLSALGSGVFDRYQARVTWLFALAGMLIAIQLIDSNPNKSMPTRVRPSEDGTQRV